MHTNLSRFQATWPRVCRLGVAGFVMMGVGMNMSHAAPSAPAPASTSVSTPAPTSTWVPAQTQKAQKTQKVQADAKAGKETRETRTGKPPQTPVFKKITTGPLLRQGMDRIAVLIRQAQMEPSLKHSAYLELADKVDAEILRVMKIRKLEGDADRAFQEIFTDILLATTLMRRDKTDIEHAGLLALTQSLKNYAKYFDHPGWNGPQGA